MTARLLYGCIHVKPVGPASGRSKRGQSLRGTVEEPSSSNRISASRVRHGHTHLRKPLPEISFLNRPRLPTRLQHLVGGERTARLHEGSSCVKCLLGRQRLLRHRLHPRSAVRQGPAQSVARPGLTSAAYGVPVTITPRHTTSLSNGGTGRAKAHPSAASPLEHEPIAPLHGRSSDHQRCLHPRAGSLRRLGAANRLRPCRRWFSAHPVLPVVERRRRGLTHRASAPRSSVGAPGLALDHPSAPWRRRGPVRPSGWPWRRPAAPHEGPMQTGGTGPQAVG